MRKINHIIIHCAATPEGKEFTIKDIEKWHRQRGFTIVNGVACGYHYVINLDGSLSVGRPLERRGAHTIGRNADSIGICYIGGCDKNMKPKDTRTELQKSALEKRVKELLKQFPGARVSGHNEWAHKACPCFDVPKWWESVK